MMSRIFELLIKNKGKIIAGVAVIAMLTFTFLWGGNAPGINKKKSALVSPDSKVNSVIPSEEPTSTPAPTISAKLVRPSVSPKAVAPTAKATVSPTATVSAKPVSVKPTAEVSTDLHTEAYENINSDNHEGDIIYSVQNGMNINEETGLDEFKTEPVPQGMPLPVEPEEMQKTDKKLTCTLSVRCDTILNNLEYVKEEKLAVIPSDGIILEEQTVEFNEGESAFQVLRREMKRNKIHLEFENVPIYNSAYIEGINNIYEFDCGELSGWMYKVNGWFPNYGCSRYELKQGDLLEFVYTCDLGRDVGGAYASGGDR